MNARPPRPEPLTRAAIDLLRTVGKRGQARVRRLAGPGFQLTSRHLCTCPQERTEVVKRNGFLLIITTTGRAALADFGAE